MSGTDFPRGWTLTGTGGSGAVGMSLTVPGISGVVHVLDSISARMINIAAAAAGPFTIALSSSDGVFGPFFLGEVFLTAAGTDEISATGLDLSAGAGASLTIAYSAGANTGNVAQGLIIQGHDI